MTGTVLAIDPGCFDSAYTLIDPDCRPSAFAKLPNRELLDLLGESEMHQAGQVVVEMIASYGMAVGAEVFETCVWIGRFCERLESHGATPVLVKRNPVKLHHCHSPKAKDSNITQALVDRFAEGQTNSGKGTKAAPGWFYGFAKDVWAAYALAVYASDTGVAAAEVPF